MAQASEATIQYWQRHVEAFNESGMTREAYSKANGIRFYQLDYWRKKCAQAKKSHEITPTKQWVPVRIIHPMPENNAHIDLWIGSVRMEIKPGFNPKLLNEILRAVDSQC